MENKLKVYSAINEITKELSENGGISKDRKNTLQGYAFRGIDDIYNTLAKLLAKHHLCIIPNIIDRVQEERTTIKGGTIFYTTVKAEYNIVSADDGSKHTAVVFGEAMDSADKSTNKAMSAAYKYLCLQTFCIPTEDDNDADATTPPEVIPQKTFVNKDITTFEELKIALNNAKSEKQLYFIKNNHKVQDITEEQQAELMNIFNVKKTVLMQADDKNIMKNLANKK